MEGKIFDVHFQVLDIPSSFTMLLGRPWIHQAEAVPPSLHQKVKFIVGDEITTLTIEQNVLTTAGQRVLQVQNLQEPKTYTSYQFEMVCTKEEAEEQKKKSEILPPKFRMMVNMKFNQDKGLGKYLQGRRELVKAVQKHSRTGLGFKLELKSRDKRQKRINF